MIPYEEWMKRPESERNAEAATVVMGWHRGSDFFGYDAWVNDAGLQAYAESDGETPSWSPCTDRNATDIVLAEVERRRLVLTMLSILLDDPSIGSTTWGCLRAPASLLVWAAVMACKEDA